MEDGSTVVVDEAYLRESIQNPGAKIVRGFPNIMPTLSLSQSDIDAVIDYIKSLRDDTGDAR